jgi:hypothetical protein
VFILRENKNLFVLHKDFLEKNSRQQFEIIKINNKFYSMKTLLVFRYMAIVHPLKDFWWCESHTTYIICLIWILALATSSPLLVYSAAVPFNYTGITLYDCREEWEGELSSMIYTMVLFVITFIIPFAALTFLYGSIGIKTFRHMQPGEAHTSRDRAQQRIKIKVL